MYLRITCFTYNHLHHLTKQDSNDAMHMSASLWGFIFLAMLPSEDLESEKYAIAMVISFVWLGFLLLLGFLLVLVF